MLEAQPQAEAQRLAVDVVRESAERKLRVFYDGIRNSSIPHLARRDRNAGDVFRASFDALLTFGKASVPLAVGFTMHQYMYSALSLIPLSDTTLAERLGRMMEHIRAKKALLAVSSFGGNVSTPDVRFKIERKDKGNAYLMNGERSFQSMASEADYVTVAAPVDGGALGSFVVPMKNRAGVTVGAAVFAGGSMALTDTRKVTFADYRARDDELVTLDPLRAHQLGVYSTAWFEGLIGAAYLGGAAAALEEVRQFVRAAKQPDGSGQPLSSLDGVIVEAGRLGVALRTCLALARGLASSIGGASEKDNFMQAMMDAVLVKHACTRTAENIVHAARRIVGTRAMKPDSVIAELTGQVVFGPLHPWLDAELERSVGAEVLGEQPLTWAVGS